MARSVAVIDSEIAVYQSYLNEWVKPLLDTSISNRFTEAIINGVVDLRMDDANLWETLDGYLIGNSNQFCIFDIGLNFNNQDDIVNAYEIGNESHHLGGRTSESLDTIRLWRLNLISNNGVYNNIHTDDSHLTPYYPDNAIKYPAYLRPLLRLNGASRVFEIDSFLESSIDSYTTSFSEFSDEDIVVVNEISSVSNSLIQEIDFTIPVNDGIFDVYFDSVNHNSVLRTEIYRAYCESMSWWYDNTGEVAEWHNGEQGIYTGRRKIVSSWQIYEWIVEEIAELNNERATLLGRTVQEIEAGSTIGEVINGIGLDNVYETMFREYPGVFNSVRIQFGYYTIDSDDPGFTEASIVQSYGYKSIDTIKASFDTTQDDNVNVSFEHLRDCFVFERTEAVSYTIYSTVGDEPNVIVNSSVHIYRLDYDKYFTYNAKNRYYLGTYFIGMKIDYNEPCQWDGLIVFIIVIIITYFLGPEAGAKTIKAFSAYLAIFSLWVNYLQLGGSKDRQIISIISIAASLYSAWQKGMTEALKNEAGKGASAAAIEMAKVQVEMAQRQVLYSVAAKGFLSGAMILLKEQMSSIGEDSENEYDNDDFEAEKDSKSSRKKRSAHENSLQFYPLERLIQKKEEKENKQNKQEFINYRLKENYGGY